MSDLFCGRWKPPEPCKKCFHYYPGNYGDYGGEMTEGPYCGINVFFPVKKQTCKRQQILTMFLHREDEG